MTKFVLGSAFRGPLALSFLNLLSFNLREKLSFYDSARVLPPASHSLVKTLGRLQHPLGIFESENPTSLRPHEAYKRRGSFQILLPHLKTFGVIVLFVCVKLNGFVFRTNYKFFNDDIQNNNLKKK